jgi:hypothetical protein
MGALFNPDEPYTLESESGAILLIVESEELIPYERAISTPRRIAGAFWPTDSPLG